jgi:hypothetical protein
MVQPLGLAVAASDMNLAMPSFVTTQIMAGGLPKGTD